MAIRDATWKPIDSLPEKIAQAVAASEWDAVVVLGVENFHYWSGVYRDGAYVYLDRPLIVVWPRDGEPTCIAPADVLGSITSLSFVTHFVGYAERGVPPPAVVVDSLAEVLRQQGLTRGLIGLEMLRSSLPFYNRLRQLMPEANFEPADDMLRCLRMVKTPREIGAVAQAGHLTETAIWRAFGSSTVGDSELDLSARIHFNVLTSGCTAVTRLMVGSGEGARVFGPPTERRLETGAMIRVDINTLHWAGAEWGRVYRSCDMGRMAVVGCPSRAQIKAYESQTELKRRILGFLRPGRTCSDVYCFACQQAKRMGVEVFDYTDIGIGHGVGVNASEYPKLSPADHTTLRPGMILAVEPDTIGPEGELIHTEDTVVVTAGGVDVLTDCHDWSTLPVIAD